MTVFHIHFLSLLRCYFLIFCFSIPLSVNAQVSEKLARDLTAWVEKNTGKDPGTINSKLIKELEEHIETEVFYREDIYLDTPRKKFMGLTSPIHRNFQHGFPLITPGSNAELLPRIDYSALIREDQEKFNKIFRKHFTTDTMRKKETTVLRRNILKLLYRRICEDHAELNRELKAKNDKNPSIPALKDSVFPKKAQNPDKKPKLDELKTKRTYASEASDTNGVDPAPQPARSPSVHALRGNQTDSLDQNFNRDARRQYPQRDFSNEIHTHSPRSIAAGDAPRPALIARPQPYPLPAHSSRSAPAETSPSFVHWLGVFPPARKKRAPKKDRKPYWQSLISSLEQRIDAIDQSEIKRREILVNLLKEHHQSYEQTFGSDTFLETSKAKATEHERNLARAKLRPTTSPVQRDMPAIAPSERQLGNVAQRRVALKRTPESARDDGALEARRQPRVRDILKDLRREQGAPKQPARRPRQTRVGDTLAHYRAGHARH